MSVLGGRVPIEDPADALSKSQNQKKLLEWMVNERPMGAMYKDLKEEDVIKRGSFHPAIVNLLELGYVEKVGPMYFPTDEALRVVDVKEFH